MDRASPGQQVVFFSLFGSLHSPVESNRSGCPYGFTPFSQIFFFIVAPVPPPLPEPSIWRSCVSYPSSLLLPDKALIPVSFRCQFLVLCHDTTFPANHPSFDNAILFLFNLSTLIILYFRSRKF